ncbi:hypothetical protein Bhyg_12810 [Pseudolycoriella hygida]|uniref:Uncharacterized protein n=1 Tax=Pseudolycoriella hygida TaxID=35572 RepID=A0A9Q0MXV9_9DIPT|nr:hypothetical protein Bhyg_12810 [Pseudolycoriella hygida]
MAGQVVAGRNIIGVRLGTRQVQPHRSLKEDN